jgi:organic radical activating enzyme
MANKRHNETDLEYKKRVLDALSPSFCGAKWYNATIWLGSGKTTSCHHPPAHFISVESIKKNYKMLHNTPEKKDDRRKMQIGERPAGCEYCWKIEDMGTDAISDRPYKSMTYNEEDLVRGFHTPYEEDIDLIALEIAFDRTCQFACSYCNPGFSTTWAKDIKKNGPYINLVTDGRNHFTHEHNQDQLYDFNETNPYIEAFFQWWEADLHRTLDELRITGGEPLMSGHTWKLFDWFKENKNKSKTRLALNSNLGFDRSVLEKMLDSTSGNAVTLYTSNEATFMQAEYIRDGLNWNQWYDNMIFLLESKRLKNLNVMCTINALCLDTLTDFLDLMLEWKAKYGKDQMLFSLNIMRFPNFQGPVVLPMELRNHYREKLSVWFEKNKNVSTLHEFEKNHVERLIDYLDIVKTPHGENFNRETAEKDFKQFYLQYDERRGKDFAAAFPGVMNDWYQSI